MTSTVVNSTTSDVGQPDGSLQARGPYRGLSTVDDTFARESYIDELAYAAGVDPVDFRLGLLDDERLATVVQAAARRFGWSSSGCPALWAKGWLRRGTGIAVGLGKGCRAATCAEVRPDGAARLRVTRIVTAIFAATGQRLGSLTLIHYSPWAGSVPVHPPTMAPTCA